MTAHLILKFLPVLLLTITWVERSQAAIPIAKKNIEPTRILSRAGAIRGGVSDQYVSLLDIRRSADAKIKIERIIIDWGNQLFEPVARGGYYQIEYREKPAQLILSLPLALNTKFESMALAKKMSKGLFVRSATLEFDNLSQATLITLNLRQNIKLKVADYQGIPAQKKTAKLVLDLLDPAGSR